MLHVQSRVDGVVSFNACFNIVCNLPICFLFFLFNNSTSFSIILYFILELLRPAINFLLQKSNCVFFFFRIQEGSLRWFLYLISFVPRLLGATVARVKMNHLELIQISKTRFSSHTLKSESSVSGATLQTGAILPKDWRENGGLCTSTDCYLFV